MATGFLISNISGKLKYLCDIVYQHSLKRLYICLTVHKNQPHLINSEWISKRVVDIYRSSSNLLPNLDVRILLNDVKQGDGLSQLKSLNVDVIILPKMYNTEELCDAKSLKNKRIIYADDDFMEEMANVKILNTKKMNIYPNVVLGGTFDRLHNGHKILLSVALLRCSKKLTVGVTDENLIRGKKLPELIEPVSERMQAVEKFIKEVDTIVDCEVVIISDIYGPTLSDPSMNMIVVSTETQKGALKINELRKEKKWKELDVHIIDLAEDSSSLDIEEKKISSSNCRMRLLGTHIRIPEPRLNLPSKPYKIGLTGGVASGKSTICEYLNTLGAGIVDCDKIGHELYKPKTELYYKIIDTFSKEILSPDGQIDRKKLGSIVFHSPEQLKKLENLMWPAIYRVATAECQRLFLENGKAIVVVEAAVLLKAQWQEKFHEVWSTIVPQEEAVSRLIKRNNLTETDANLRVNAQSSNSEFVAVSNVIFCSLWSYEYTRQQVNKAWESVQKYLKNNEELCSR